MKRYPFEDVLNVRDLGGYPVGKTRRTLYGRVLRASLPCSLTADEILFLRQAGITQVIDLRSPKEVEERASAFSRLAGFDYQVVAASLSTVLPAREEEVPLMYMSMADNHAAMAQVLGLIAHAPGGVLYHCTAGKDRTGVVSALLLSLAGCEPQDIVADYQVSYTYIEPMILGMALTQDIPLFICQSKPGYMQGFLERFYAQYGDCQAYCKRIGLKDEEIAALRAKLLED